MGYVCCGGSRHWWRREREREREREGETKGLHRIRRNPKRITKYLWLWFLLLIPFFFLNPTSSSSSSSYLLLLLVAIILLPSSLYFVYKYHPPFTFIAAYTIPYTSRVSLCFLLYCSCQRIVSFIALFLSSFIAISLYFSFFPLYLFFIFWVLSGSHGCCFFFYS